MKHYRARTVNGKLVSYTIDGVDQLAPGLGDKIARVAQPIARVIDKVAGTKIAGCGGCKKMKDRLNAGMGLGEAIKKRLKGE